MFKRILKIVLGVFSLPICYAVSVSLYEQLGSVKVLSYYNKKYFLVGAVAYLAVHAAVFKPKYLYIFGHEVMHVLATWTSGGKVSSFHVSSQGGKIVASKSNIFIALAPYFFPFYTIFIALIFFILRLFTTTHIPYSAFLFLVGFTLTFHIILTIDFLKTKQSDFAYAGYLLSICLIYIVNIFVISFIFSLLFGSADFIDFFNSVISKSRDIYFAIISQLFL